MYKPLPDNLTIKESLIEGLGLFATSNIKANTILGISHIYDERFPNNYIRTPLGGFFNHSENPNCRLGNFKFDEELGYINHLKLITIKDIQKGEEITTKYTWYKPQ